MTRRVLGAIEIAGALAGFLFLAAVAHAQFPSHVAGRAVNPGLTLYDQCASAPTETWTSPASGNSYIRSYCDSFNDSRQRDVIVNPFNETARYFDRRVYNQASGSCCYGPRYKTDQWNAYFDSQFNFGYGDSNGGRLIEGGTDALRFLNHQAIITMRALDNPSDEYTGANGVGGGTTQSTTTVQFTTHNSILAYPPFAAEITYRYPAGVTGGSQNGAHGPSFWMKSINPAVTENNIEIDFEQNGSTGQQAATHIILWQSLAQTTYAATPAGACDSATPTTMDGKPHTLVIEVLQSGVNFYVDGNLCGSNSAYGASGVYSTYATGPEAIVIGPMVWDADFSLANWQKFGHNGQPAIFSEFKVFRLSTATHLVPITTIPDILIANGGAVSAALPSATTAYGSAASGFTLALEALEPDDVDPCAENNGNPLSTTTGLPPGLTFSGGTLAGTMTGTPCSQPGRLPFILYAFNTGAAGGTTVPIPFSLDVGPDAAAVYPPQGRVGAAFTWSPGYAAATEGTLVTPNSHNPKGYSINGNGSGSLSVSINGAGAPTVSGTPVTADAGNDAGDLRATNRLGQFADLPDIQIGGTAGTGVAAPTGISSCSIIGSLDFDNDAAMTLNEGNLISSAAGVDGTSYAAVQATASHQPVRNVVADPTGNMRFAATFLLGNSTAFDWSAAIAGLTLPGAFTLVAIAAPTSVSAAATLVDIADEEAASNTSRYDLGFSIAANTGWVANKESSGAALGQAKQAVTITTAAHELIAESPGSGTNGLTLNVDGTDFSPGSTVADPASVAGITIGAGCAAAAATTNCSAAKMVSKFSGTIWRVLLYPCALTSGERGTIHSWAQTNYGTT